MLSVRSVVIREWRLRVFSSWKYRSYKTYVTYMSHTLLPAHFSEATINH